MNNYHFTSDELVSLFSALLDRYALYLESHGCTPSAARQAAIREIAESEAAKQRKVVRP